MIDIQPIIQFGTSRFLLAHADLFISQALAGQAGASEALGGITIVQTTASAQSAQRVAALAQGAGYPVIVRGLQGGQRVEETLTCQAVRSALQARDGAHWQALRAAVADGRVRLILSNTADAGYTLHAGDSAASLDAQATAPESFPAKLLVLLHGRWQAKVDERLSLLPCELIERNGDVLRGIVCELAQQWGLGDAFVHWLQTHCVWGNSLVDRIVSEAIEPVGAVAEPYALWAIENQRGLQLPCKHPAIVLTDTLDHYERLKLFLLNAAHSYLAERWLADGRAPDETVRQAMQDAPLRADLEALWAEEILPVFGAEGSALREEAQAYVQQVRERFENPFLQHRIADIAGNHRQKKQRRFAPIVAHAQSQGLQLPQTRLKQALESAYGG